MEIIRGGLRFRNIAHLKDNVTGELETARSQPGATVPDWIAAAVIVAWRTTGLESEVGPCPEPQMRRAGRRASITVGEGGRLGVRAIMELIGVTSTDAATQAADTAHAVDQIRLHMGLVTRGDAAKRPAAATTRPAPIMRGGEPVAYTPEAGSVIRTMRQEVGHTELRRLQSDFSKVGSAQISLLTALRRIGAPRDVYDLARTAARLTAECEDDLFGVVGRSKALALTTGKA